jgi:hypothetical protein
MADRWTDLVSVPSQPYLLGHSRGEVIGFESGYPGSTRVLNFLQFGTRINDEGTPSLTAPEPRLFLCRPLSSMVYLMSSVPSFKAIITHHSLAVCSFSVSILLTPR